MKLTTVKLKQLLKLNTELTLKAISSDDTTRLNELILHRVIVKDCIIEQLENENKQLTIRNEVFGDIIDSKCQDEEIVSKRD